MLINSAGYNKTIHRNFCSNNKSLNRQSFSINSKKEKKYGINLPVLAGTIAGTLLPMLAVRKYQGKAIQAGALSGKSLISRVKAIINSFNIKYGSKELIFVGFGSIFGGLFGGLASEKSPTSRKNKVKESIFSLLNISLPIGVTSGLLHIIKNVKELNGTKSKIAVVLLGAFSGMALAKYGSDQINNIFIDKANVNNKALKPTDFLMQIDDIAGTLVLAKIPFADKLQVGRILPFIFGMGGYEAGNKK